MYIKRTHFAFVLRVHTTRVANVHGTYYTYIAARVHKTCAVYPMQYKIIKSIPPRFARIIVPSVTHLLTVRVRLWNY